METPQLLELLAAGPVIAAVKDEEGLAQALESDVSVLFLLYGDILTIRDTAERVREAGKRVFVHLDLIDGLAAREISADFVARSTSADGVISTKAALTRRARELGLVAIQRIFLLDSMALKNVERHFSRESADLVEVLPAVYSLPSLSAARVKAPAVSRVHTVVRAPVVRSIFTSSG